MRMALTVSYYDPKDLKQLSDIYRETLFEQPSTGSETEQRSTRLSSAIDSQAKSSDANSDRQYIYGGQNLSEFGKIEHNQDQEASSRSRPSGQTSSKPLGINSQSHDRYSYTRNCPTRFNDPTGNTECDKGELAAGVIVLVVSDIFLGLPLAYVIITTGGVTPAAITAEVLETIVVLPLTALGLYFIIDSGCVDSE